MAESMSFTVLMPTGLMVTARVHNKATFDEVKDAAWKEARAMPFYAVLKVR